MDATSVVWRVLLASAWAVLCASAPSTSLVAQQPPTVASRPLAGRVVLAPQFYLLSSEGGEGAPSPNEEPAAMRGVRRALAAHGAYFEAVGAASLAEQITTQERYEENLTLARGMRDLGLERYRELELAQAIEYLTQSRQAYLRIRHDVVAPEELGEVIFYLALSHLERGENAALSLGLFREMILLDPWFEVLPGYFPENVVSAYQTARRGLIQELERRGLPLELDAQARSLATLSGADQVLFGFVVPAERGGYVVRLFVWSSEAGKVEVSDEWRLEEASEAQLELANERMVGRWIDCLKPAPEVVEPTRIAPPRGSEPGRLGVDMALTYGTYLGFPRLRDDLEPASPGQVTHFGNYGLSVGGAWRVRQEFAAVARVRFWLSQREHNGLIDARDVTSLQGGVGGELGVRLWRVRPAIQVLMVGGHVSDFSILGELKCASRPPTGECAPELTRESYVENGLFIGAELAPMVTVQLSESLELLGRSSITYYLYESASDETGINLPWGGEFGVRYRF